MAFVARTIDTHALSLLLLFALGVQFEDAHGVTTDGVIYFSQLRSVLFDGDLNVAREFAYLGQPPRPYHVVPIGPTIVWVPLYLIVAGIDIAGRALGFWPEPADPIAIGLSLPYVRAALVSSFAIGAVGLFAVHRHLRGGFDRGVSFATSALLFSATPLVWYMVYEPSMTHAASFGFVALFVTAAARWTSRRITVRQSMHSRRAARARVRVASAGSTVRAAAGGAAAERHRELAHAPPGGGEACGVGLRRCSAVSGASSGAFGHPLQSRELCARRCQRLSRSLALTLVGHVVVVVAWISVVVADRLRRRRRHGVLRDARVALGAGDAAHRAADGVDQRIDRGLECRLVVRRAPFRELPGAFSRRGWRS